MTNRKWKNLEKKLEKEEVFWLPKNLKEKAKKNAKTEPKGGKKWQE